MYHLYHIPNRKEWGCTKNLESRVKKLGYTMSDVSQVITIIDLNEAADMEKELNIKEGYGWNPSQDYRRVKSMARLGGLKVGKKNGLKNKQSGHLDKICVMGGLKQGPITGQKNKESGHMRNLGLQQAYTQGTCPYCNKSGQLRVMKRWHFDNCKSKIVK
jgi:hypothetical protein